MTPTTRKTTSPATAVAPTATTDLPPEAVPASEPAGAPPPAPGATGQGGSALVGLITFPVRASERLVRDVGVTARNPEAVAYWGGLAALAVVGALEWPVAAAAGVGVVVAGAVRRGRG